MIVGHDPTDSIIDSVLKDGISAERTCYHINLTTLEILLGMDNPSLSLETWILTVNLYINSTDEEGIV